MKASRDGEKGGGNLRQGQGLGKCRCMKSSEVPWNACAVTQMSELSLSQCVWSSHLPGCHTLQARRVHVRVMTHGTFGDPQTPDAEERSWLYAPLILCPSTMPSPCEKNSSYFSNISRYAQGTKSQS